MLIMLIGTMKNATMLSTTEAAHRIGYKSRRSLLLLIRRGEFPRATRLGHHYRIPASDVADFIRRRSALVSASA